MSLSGLVSCILYQRPVADLYSSCSNPRSLCFSKIELQSLWRGSLLTPAKRIASICLIAVDQVGQANLLKAVWVKRSAGQRSRSWNLAKHQTCNRTRISSTH